MFTLIVLLNTAEKWLVVQGLIEICCCILLYGATTFYYLNIHKLSWHQVFRHKLFFYSPHFSQSNDLINKIDPLVLPNADLT